jgi:hypothetical protein
MSAKIAMEVNMSLFETEDEMPEGWHEKEVDKHEERHEKDEKDRKKSGFADKTDDEWLSHKQDREYKEEQKFWKRSS